MPMPKRSIFTDDSTLDHVPFDALHYTPTPPPVAEESKSLSVWDYFLCGGCAGFIAAAIIILVCQCSEHMR